MKQTGADQALPATVEQRGTAASRTDPARSRPTQDERERNSKPDQEHANDDDENARSCCRSSVERLALTQLDGGTPDGVDPHQNRREPKEARQDHEDVEHRTSVPSCSP